MNVSYRNQSTDLLCKFIAWFFYNGVIDFKWLNQFFNQLEWNSKQMVYNLKNRNQKRTSKSSKFSKFCKIVV